MHYWDDLEEAISVSSDSGFESAEETLPSNADSVLSIDANALTNCSGLSSTGGCSVAASYVQELLVAMQSFDAIRMKTSTGQLFKLCRLGFTGMFINYAPQMFDSLRLVVTTYDTSKDPELAHCLSGIFYYLTEHNHTVETMPVDSVLTIITKLLSIPLESSLNYTVSGLHNLLENRPLRDKLRTPPIITFLVQILWTCFLFDKSFHPNTNANPYLAFASSTLLAKFISILCDSLYILAHRNEMTKRLIHAKRGVGPLLYFAHTYPFEKLQGTCARLLRILSTHPQTKRDILKNDPELGFFKKFEISSVPSLSLNALWTLRNLSDECGNIPPQQISEIVGLLLKRLRDLEKSNWNSKDVVSEDLHSVYAVGSCVSGILANFTCRNPFAKSNLVRNGAVPLLHNLLAVSTAESACHKMFCPSANLRGPCVDFSTFDPIPLSLVSCPCGHRSVPLNLLQSTVDCAEATLRCLTHLTSSHQLAGEAIYQIEIDHRKSGWRDMACWIVGLFTMTSGNSNVDQGDHPVRLTSDQRNSLDPGRVLLLAKAWLSLCRNCLTAAFPQGPEQKKDLTSAINFMGTALTTHQSENAMELPEAAHDTVESCRQLIETLKQL